MTGFTDVLGKRLLVCDGAMGTMLHASGCALDRALPEVNLSDPALVATIHESYVSAGADIIQTNTFGANRLWLADHGYPDQVEEINRSAVRIARAVGGRSSRAVYVAGAISPAVTARQRRQVGAAERADVITEQVQALATAGVDVLILETFGYLDELAEAVAVASEVCDIPIVAQATFADDGRTLGGETPHEVASVLGELPIVMLGSNCTTGPQRMLAVVENLVQYSSLPVSAQPNAGQPRRIGERHFEFSIDGSYFARYLRRFAEAGAALVGGCCGTTPTHIGAAVTSLGELRTAVPRTAAAPPPRPARTPPSAAASGLTTRLASREFVIAAEIAAPDDGAVRPGTDTVIAVREQGVDLFAITAPDNPRAHRDSLGMALHLQQHAGVEAIVTMTTWNKTIMTLQADLLGAHALGIRGIICEAGTPPVLGDYPAVDGIWEVDSLGLVTLLAGLNSGRDFDGLPLTTKTAFCIGTRVNPGASDLTAEIARARAEVRAGTQFLVTRPVYELGPLRLMAEALADTGVPVLLSVSPLRSFEEAEYLAHEVPDVDISAATLRAMEQAGQWSARETGLELARCLLREGRPLVGGVLLTMAHDDAAVLGPLLATMR
ncbi:MAG: bifunctional homocysteine S-methyltransferase/methylenetetrahydrofolate reductase [Streptosporangiaceae bacterium]